MKSFCHVRDPELVICLSGDPGPCHYLVVKTDNNGPFAVDLGKAVNDTGCTLLVKQWVI